MTEMTEDQWDFACRLNRICNKARGYKGPVCSHCDRAIVLDDRIPLMNTGEFLCVSCDDQLKEELDDFTSNYQPNTG